MKYTMGDLFTWKYDQQEMSTLINIWYDWDGKKKYQLESFLKGDAYLHIKETYTEHELDTFIDTGILLHYPVK